ATESAAHALEASGAEVESLVQSMALVPQPNAPVDGESGNDEAPMSDEARGVLAAIKRLEDIVDEETAALEARQPVDLAEFSLRKSRSMLEFARLSRTITLMRNEPNIADNLQKLRLKLEKNRALLQMHLEAACEVATIIARTIMEAESDGTYSADV